MTTTTAPKKVDTPVFCHTDIIPYLTDKLAVQEAVGLIGVIAKMKKDAAIKEMDNEENETYFRLSLAVLSTRLSTITRCTNFLPSTLDKDNEVLDRCVRSDGFGSTMSNANAAITFARDLASMVVDTYRTTIQYINQMDAEDKDDEMTDLLHQGIRNYQEALHMRYELNMALQLWDNDKDASDDSEDSSQD